MVVWKLILSTENKGEIIELKENMVVWKPDNLRDEFPCSRRVKGKHGCVETFSFSFFITFNYHVKGKHGCVETSNLYGPTVPVLVLKENMVVWKPCKIAFISSLCSFRLKENMVVWKLIFVKV